MPFELTILGSNSAVPMADRFPSAQILALEESLYLIDCGEGTQMRMMEHHIRRSKIQQIFISHLHGDHIFGLIGLITGFSLSRRQEPLEIFSPIGLEEIIRTQLKYGGAKLSYELSFRVVDTTISTCIFSDHHLLVYSIPLVHRIPTSGYLFVEKERPSNVRGDLLVELGIDHKQIPAIRQGADAVAADGRIISNKLISIPPPKPRSFAYCSDTLYHPPIVPIIQGADLLYHESTFMTSHEQRALETQHSTAMQAAMIAKKAGVGSLILGHYSSRYRDLLPLLAEAQAVFPNSELGLEGKKFTVERKRR